MLYDDSKRISGIARTYFQDLIDSGEGCVITPTKFKNYLRQRETILQLDCETSLYNQMALEFCPNVIPMRIYPDYPIYIKRCFDMELHGIVTYRIVTKRDTYDTRTRSKAGTGALYFSRAQDMVMFTLMLP